MEPTERAGLYSVAVNVFLVGLKLGLAIVSGSLSLAADAVHSLVDVVASLVVLAGLLIAKRQSRAFPYGLYKVENVVSVVLALLIFLAGYEIAREAWLKPPRVLANTQVALAGVTVAILTAWAFSRYERRLSERSGSPSLAADSRHFQTDVLASGVVFIAILGSVFGLPLDRAGAVVVVLFVIWAGWGLLADGMRVLLDASIEDETLEQVRRIISSDRAVHRVESLRGRNSGRFKFLEAEIALRTRDLEKAHQVSRRLEARVKESVPHVDKVLIHYEPLHRETWRCAVPLEDLEGPMSLHFGQAPYFAIVEVRFDGGQIVSREVLANPYRTVDRQKGIRAAEFLIEHQVDSVVVAESLEGKGPSYVLADAGIEVRVVPKAGEAEAITLEQALGELCPRPDGAGQP